MAKSPAAVARGRARFLTFGAPAISDADVRAVTRVLRSGWLGTGPCVRAFEDAFAHYKGAGHAVAVSSCSAALQLTLVSAGIGEGDEVITTPLTFCATVNAIIHAGATPVLADVDPATKNLDPAAVSAAISPRTRAIVPVHFAGLPCDMPAIGRIARAAGLTVIEDCAHAIEAERDGEPAGTIGDYGCFSFYVTKNITTGDGGMILTRTAAQASRLRSLSRHGLSADAWTRRVKRGFQSYDVCAAGYKFNMTDLQAALGLSQLRRIDASWQRRHALWRRYMAGLAGLPLGLPPIVPPGTRHAHHLFTVSIDPARIGLDRAAVGDRLAAAGIGAGIHYRSLADEPFYRARFGWRAADYPHAHRIGRQTLSLPLSSGMIARDVDRVVETLTAICRDPRRTAR